MTSRLLPAAATAAACIALIGYAVHTLTPQQPHRTAPSTVQHGTAGLPADTHVALLIEVATQHVQQLLRCPATTGPAATRSPALSSAAATVPARPTSRQSVTGAVPRTCGQLTVLRAEPGPATGGAGTVLLIALLQPDPLLGNGSGPSPVPMTLRLQVRRGASGGLIAQVIGP